jgi:hypothetical protein
MMDKKGKKEERRGKRGVKRERERGFVSSLSLSLFPPLFPFPSSLFAFLERLEVLRNVTLLLIAQAEAADAVIVLDDVEERPCAPIVEVGRMLP